MALVVVNRDPSARDLRWSGALFAAFAGVVGTIVAWKMTLPAVAIGGWILGAVMAAVYYAMPALQRPFYMAWMYAAFPVGWVVSHLVLVIAYYGVLTPTGIVARLAGHDPLQRRPDRRATTYWVRRRSGGDVARYFRQF